MTKLKVGHIYLYEYSSFKYVIKITEVYDFSPDPRCTIEVLKDFANPTETYKAFIDLNLGIFKPITEEVYNTLYKDKL